MERAPSRKSAESDMSGYPTIHPSSAGPDWADYPPTTLSDSIQIIPVVGRRYAIGQLCKNVCAVLAFGCAATPLTPAPQSTSATKPTPLILEKNEGERRVVRGWPGHPDPGETFILKVDPKNGGSSHLVFMTGDLAPGGEIVAHRHPDADEILFLQTGTARVHLGDSERSSARSLNRFHSSQYLDFCHQ
jgi:hypothetical protein